MAYRRLCNKLLLKTVSAPNGHDYRVTKYGADNDPIASFIGQQQGGEQFDFGKPAWSFGGSLLNPLHQKIISILAQGNSTQAAASVPKYNVQGKSKVYNQLVHNGNFVGTSNWDASSASLSASDNVATFLASAQYGRITQRNIPFVNGHKYLLLCAIKQSSAHTGTYIMYTKDSNQTIGTGAATTDWQARQVLFTFNQTSGSGAIVIGDNRSGGWDETLIKNVMLVDATAIYGAGNEPATISAFLADYPFFSDYVAYTTGAIHSISSITIGGQTVSVDLRSAGSVADEWATNSRGTRRIGIVDLGGLHWTKDTDGDNWAFYVSEISGMKSPAYAYNAANMICALYTTVMAQGNTDYSTDKVIFAKVNGQVFIVDRNYSTAADFETAMSGVYLLYELASSAPFTAGSPLTLASGLTPTDQNGDSVSFTETTEATPSPNYPVLIVNSTLISITDGEDINSAAVDLAGLTDRDELYVNVKSTNIWDEEWEAGTLKEDGTHQGSAYSIVTLHDIAVEPNTYYYYNVGTGGYLVICYYDSEHTLLDRLYGYSRNAAYQTPANAVYMQFSVIGGYGNTYNHDISISLGSSAVPYMPHDTIGKVWKRQQVGRVELTDLTYNYDGNGLFLSGSISGIVKRPASGYQAADMLCEGFVVAGAQNVSDQPQYNYRIGVYINGVVYLRCNECASISQLQSVISGLKLIYALASPVWTDITSTATGAALLAMETYEGDTNTADCLNGDIDVRFWRQV